MDFGNMEILILTPNGETVIMSTCKKETVIDLKKRISEKLFMAPDLQKILFHGYVLDDENSLEQFAIEDKSVITLVKGLRGAGIIILAKTTDGRAIVVEIDPAETVLDLKKKIKEILNIDHDDQRLIYVGREIFDEKKLKDYYITVDSVIHVIPRYRGGCLMVTVKTIDGKSATLECTGKETILDLKKKIYPKLSIIPDLQILIFQLGILDDEEKISHLPFCSQSVINLIEAASRQILVRTSDGETVKLEMGGTKTVRDLKRRIATKLSLTIEELKLVFQDIVLEDDTMIDKLNILEDSVISVHIMKRICFVKDGKEIVFQVGMEETISDIKRKICEKVQCSSNDIQLCYKAGQRLKDDKTLLDYKIEDTAQIRVLLL